VTGLAPAEDGWHALPGAEVVERLASDAAQGLDAAETARRLASAGPNALRRGERVSAWILLARQFRSLVIWMLIGASVISIALGQRADGIAIIAIVILNAVIGFFLEYRAERAMAALARLAAPRARVVRAGRAGMVEAVEIVPGDVLLLDAGDVVAADARVLESSALRTHEAPLTGESHPVEKHAEICPRETVPADRRNMVFLGTGVVSGSWRAVVTATGMGTEVGRIAELLATARRDETPLQRRLDQGARRLLWAAVGIVALVFILGLLRAIAPFELFLAAVSLAVAAVPESLPAVVTVALALGVERMARRNVLVRRLPAVETLGGAQVICTDKTGTLTVGEMTVRKVVTSARIYRVTGEGYTTQGAFLADGTGYEARDEQLLEALLLAAAACNDAELTDTGRRSSIVGDPTEGALLVASAKAGLTRDDIDARMPRLATLPFDSDRKRMTVVRSREGRPWAFVKGAPETLLERCSGIRTEVGVRDLTESDRAGMLQAGAVMASEALRILAVAERPLDPAALSGPRAPDEAGIECGLSLLGLVGIQDPPRPEARESIQRCKRAGIRTVMITGDHPDTARAIARELDILGRDDQVVAGPELERMSDRELTERVARIAVYARATPEHKLRILRAWKSHGAVVAMTGDGVNDAPALKEASIGIAMGVTGTEVAKESADIVITDDNFASIVAAVEEGRGIYDNIGKTLAYLLAGNAGELAVMLTSTLVGWPLPLLPLHLLWINLVTDGLPALALATDPVDPAVLDRPPRHPQAPLLDGRLLATTALTGGLTAFVALTAFVYELSGGGELTRARDAAFTVLVISELLRSFGARSATRTVLEIGLFSNLRLVGIVAVGFLLQLAIHHVAPLRELFDVTPISLDRCAAWFALGFVPLIVLELRKVYGRTASEDGGTRPEVGRAR
jgi:Ca2+-transporting ATPase